MLALFRKLMPREDRFFDLFARHSQTLVAGAKSLEKLLEGGEDVQRYCREVAAHEQEADDITREVLISVRRTFITPFDRGNIQLLIQSMDDAIDQMHKTAKAVTLYELRDFDPLMRDIGAAIVDAARVTAEAVPLLAAIGTHAVRLNVLTEEVTKIESRADDLHDQGLKALLKTSGRADPMAYIVGSEIYGHLESVVDRFEDVANEINGIVIENV